MTIEKFETLEEYIIAEAQREDLAGVPIPLVAEHWEVTPAAVSAMVKSNRLHGVRIGEKTTLVTLASLRALEEMEDEQVDRVQRYLKKLARKGTRAIFYEPIMNQIDLKTDVPAHRKRIGFILGNVSDRSFEEHGVLLSVLVHKKTAGVTRPGEGFFKLARDKGFKFHDPDKFVKEHTDEVLARYK